MICPECLWTHDHVHLQCEMDNACRKPVSYIDDKGFIYCEPCGLIRQTWRRCRKLRSHELNRLARGEQVAHY